MTATTALTAQNTLGVEDVHITPPAFVAKQIDASLSDIGCDVVKLGRLKVFLFFQGLTDISMFKRNACISRDDQNNCRRPDKTWCFDGCT